MIASDGLEYENITQRLLGNPAKNLRNSSILEVRHSYAVAETEAFATAYDKARGGHADKYNAGWRAIDKARSAANRKDFGVIDTRVRPQSC